MTERGKNYQTAVKELVPNTAYEPEKAIELAKKVHFAKFDETVELHLRMGLDPKNSAHQIRGTSVLPHGLGKKIRILVFAQGDAARAAQSAGADSVGAEDIIKKIEEGWLDFDTAIATPDMMGKVGKLGKILGRRGLMPNPKSGTVVGAADLPRVIEDARKGRVEFKLDRTAIVHLVLGKASFDTKKLVENLATVMDAIVKAKPTGVKGIYIRSATITTTMGPGINLDLKSMEIPGLAG